MPLNYTSKYKHNLPLKLFSQNPKYQMKIDLKNSIQHSRVISLEKPFAQDKVANNIPRLYHLIDHEKRVK